MTTAMNEDPQDVLPRIIRNATWDVLTDAEVWTSDSQTEHYDRTLVVGRTSGAPTIAFRIAQRGCIMTVEHVRALAISLVGLVDGTNSDELTAWTSNSHRPFNDHALSVGRHSGAIMFKIETEACILNPGRMKAFTMFLLRVAIDAEVSTARWLERHTNDEGHYIE